MTRLGDLGMIEYLLFEAFVEAIKHSQATVAEWLCDAAKFDVDQEMVKYPKRALFTALQDCSTSHRYRTIEMILLKRADPNRTYAAVTGTPLQAALQMKEPDRQHIVDLLLSSGADPNARTRKDVRRMRAPLLYAARRGEVDLLRNLFKHRADPRVICRCLTIVDEAKRGKIREEVAEMLVEFGWEERFRDWARQRQSG
ncbi:hypothetical protein BDW74DRAFT_111478 [Aspergillus multicolor]|uniref:ankyrin repeat domain-containing protein n=1 Tax=Aspergillus multicolor TaxID=41759 RepID=UPI003CCE124C